MSTLNEKQYRAISYNEVKYNKPLTVRIVRDNATNLNNYKAHVGNHKLISDIWASNSSMNSWMHYYGGVGFMGIDPTSELIKQIYAPRYMSPGYSRLLIQSLHQRYAGAGSTTWRLYAVKEFLGSIFHEKSVYYWPLHSDGGYRITYISSAAQLDIRHDSNDFSGYQMHSWTTNSGSNVMESGIFNCTTSDASGDICFILTAQNSDYTTLSRLLTLDVTPLVAT